MDIRYRLKFNMSDGSQIDAGELVVPRGENGKTPVKGVDYWTADDQAEIVRQVIENLGGNSVFGYIDQSNNIIIQGSLANGTYSIKYEMEDGSKLDIGNLVLGDGYTPPVQPTGTVNQIPLSQNADGTPFVGENGEKGYKSNTRWDRNTDSETTVSGCGLTGFIPVTSNDKIYVTGFEYNDEIKPIIVLFNSSKEEVLLDSSFTYTGYVWATEENGVWTIDVTKMKSGVAFCRFSALGMTDETILTVNQDPNEDDISYYKGSYEVTPSITGQTMATKNKLMLQDVNIEAIPCNEVTNNTGGTTVTIGREE